MSFEKKSTPDQIINFAARGKSHVYELPNGNNVTVITVEPGWKWSIDVKPLLNQSKVLCDMEHNIYCIDGEMTVVMQDGSSFSYSAGDFVHIVGEHDAFSENGALIIDIGGTWNQQM